MQCMELVHRTSIAWSHCGWRKVTETSSTIDKTQRTHTTSPKNTWECRAKFTCGAFIQPSMERQRKKRRKPDRKHKDRRLITILVLRTFLLHFVSSDRLQYKIQ